MPVAGASFALIEAPALLSACESEDVGCAEVELARPERGAPRPHPHAACAPKARLESVEKVLTVTGGVDDLLTLVA